MQSGQNPAPYLYAIGNLALLIYIRQQIYFNLCYQFLQELDQYPCEVSPIDPINQQMFSQGKFIRHVNESKTPVKFIQSGACFGFFTASFGHACLEEDIIPELEAIQNTTAVSPKQEQLVRQIVKAQEDQSKQSTTFSNSLGTATVSRDKRHRFLISDNEYFSENLEHILNAAFQLAIQNLGGRIGIYIQRILPHHILEFGAIRRGDKIIFQYFDSNFGKVEFDNITTAKQSLKVLLLSYRLTIMSILLDVFSARVKTTFDQFHSFPSEESCAWVRDSIFSPKKDIGSWVDRLEREIAAGNPETKKVVTKKMR